MPEFTIGWIFNFGDGYWTVDNMDLDTIMEFRAAAFSGWYSITSCMCQNIFDTQCASAPSMSSIYYWSLMSVGLDLLKMKLKI